MLAGSSPVPLPASLPAVVLSYLVPTPNPPLPPEILSLSLTQLHTYLPPSLDDPVAHFLPSSTVSADVKQRIADAVHEIGRLMGESEHPPLEPTYAFPDPLTLQARVLLFATHDFREPTLEVVFTYEGPERSWRLEGLRLVNEPPSGIRWSSLEQALHAGREAAERLAHEHELDEAKGEDDRTDDFWGGYDSPPPAEEDDGPTLGRVGSSASIGDDYWAQYGAVDDHVGPPSNGVSPKVGTQGLPNSGAASARSSLSGRRSSGRDGWQKEAWGTGGETPVGWTPIVTPEHFINDPRNRSGTVTQQDAQFSGPSRGSPDRRRSSSMLSAGSGASERYPFPTPGSEDGGDHPRRYDRKQWAAAMPVFPEPDFKGLTPASMTPSTPPEAPQTSRLPLGTTILAAPPPSSSARSATVAAGFGQHSDSNPIKLTLPDFAAPQQGGSRVVNDGSSFPVSVSAQDPLRSALAGLFAMHLAAHPAQSRQQAAADWLKVALDVVAAQSGAVVNLDGDDSPEASQTPVGAVGPWGV